MDIINNFIDRFRPKEKSTRVDVQMIDKSAMNELRKKASKDTPDVDMETWQETDGTVPIINHGAAPCLIVYAVNTETGHVISGHFPEHLKRRQEYFDRKELQYAQDNYSKPDNPPTGIEIPDQKTVNFLSYDRVDKGYEQYLKLKERLKEWGTNKVELFLFGNNAGAFGETPEEYAGRIVKSAIEQHDAMAEFYEIGIPYTNQHDFRTPGQDNVDDTFYSPKDRVIKHSIRVHRDEGKFWIKQH